MFQGFEHVIDHVDDYLHGLLRQRAADYVEKHCGQCPVCEAALGEARKRQTVFETVPPVEVPAGLVERTVTHVGAQADRLDRRRRITWFTYLSGVAAAVLILGSLNVYYLRLTPSPFDVSVLGQQQLLAGASASLRVRVMNRNTGAAVAGVPVKIELRDKTGKRVQELARFETDAQGTGQPRFQLPDWEDGDYRLQVVAATGWWSSDELAEDVKLKRSWKLLLTADKPVYQPGQEIHLRSLALRRPDLKPVAARAAIFAITDPKGNVVFKRKDLTSKFGIAFADFPLATEITEGTYTIACQVGDTQSKLAVEVKKYVLPKFKVEIAELEPYYRPGQRLKGKVRADYFFGKPVSDAEVQLRLTSDLQGDKPIREEKLKTDADGKAAFDILLPEKLFGRPQDQGDARVFLEATVTDPAGQTQVRSTSRVVTNQVLKIEVIPEGGTRVLDLVNHIYVYVSYPDGRPAAKSKVLVAGIDKELVTNEFGVASFDLPPRSVGSRLKGEVDVPGRIDVRSLVAPEDQNNLTVKATDAKGNQGTRSVWLGTSPAGDDFLVRPDKAVYNGGDTVRLTALGGGVEPIFIDLIKDGQTMLTDSIPVSNGRGTYLLDLPAELFGTVELVAYRFAPPVSPPFKGGDTGGVPIRKSRVLYIRQASQVNIKAELDKKEYRPGKTAKLRLALRDADGKPIAGAISLSAVDEAVFSVLEQRPGMEKTFYNLEQKLLQPVYTIYPWSPNFDAPPQVAEDYVQLEQALFARTVRTEIATTGNGQAGQLHSLQDSSFPRNVEKVEQRRATGLGRVHTGWIVFVALLGVAGTIHLCLVYHPVQRVNNYLEAINDAHAEGEPGPRMSIVGCSVALTIGFVFCLASIQIIGSNSNKAFGTVGASIGAVTGGDWLRVANGAMEKSPEKKSDDAPRPVRTTDAKPPEPKAIDAPPVDEPAEPLRVREFFPETLLWRPELITDEQGNASLDIELADSITTWRLSASAVTADGRLGAAQESVRVFQPFFVDLNLPVSLTRNDETAVAAVVYNYLQQPQTVSLQLEPADWFSLLAGDPIRSLELKPGERREVRFTIKVKKVGQQPLTVKATSDKLGDAIKRWIEVVPDGKKVERVVNGTLDRPVDLVFAVPADAIEGSPRLILKVYPSSFSQLVEGLENIFRMPYGCFEQTSSTTYPNVLALDYLKRTGKSAPAIEAKARQYIHLGYQRLLGFEVQGGGFDWFGRPPANVRLTAYGLMEFTDMAKVHDVDPKMIERTRQWLLSKRDANGSWSHGQGLHQEADPARGQADDLARYSTTAYVAWAVFAGQPAGTLTRPGERHYSYETYEYLLSVRPDRLTDPYVLALACNALLALDPNGKSAASYIDRLNALKRAAPDGKLAWWEQAAGGHTAFYGAGQSGNIETTALATLALLKANQYPGTARSALAWLIQQKDASGTWHSTQATVLALKALLAGTGKSLAQDQERKLEVDLGGGKRKLAIAPDQGDVMLQLDLSEQLKTGDNRLAVTETSGTGAGFQLAFRYHVPTTDQGDPNEPLAIAIAYDRTELAVNEVVKAKATVRNRMQQEAPMVILDLPIPAGFTVNSDAFTKLVEAGTIARFQVTARQVLVYLRGLAPGQTLELAYELRATLPVKVSVPGARAYEYYDPSKQGSGRVVQMTVKE